MPPSVDIELMSSPCPSVVRRTEGDAVVFYESAGLAVLWNVTFDCDQQSVIAQQLQVPPALLHNSDTIDTDRADII